MIADVVAMATESDTAHFVDQRLRWTVDCQGASAELHTRWSCRWGVACCRGFRWRLLYFSSAAALLLPKQQCNHTTIQYTSNTRNLLLMLISLQKQTGSIYWSEPVRKYTDNQLYINKCPMEDLEGTKWFLSCRVAQLQPKVVQVVVLMVSFLNLLGSNTVTVIISICLFF